MQNYINFNNYTSVTTSTTLGFLPGMTTPASLLVCNAAAGITITLPPTATQLAVLPPQAPANGQAIDGVGGGFEMIVFNANGAAAVTVVAATGDQIIGTATVAGTINSFKRLRSAPVVTSWYVVG